MKNPISFFLLSFCFGILLFTSCTKDHLSETVSLDNFTVEERNTTIEMQVTGVAFSIVSQEIIVDYTASYDFSEAELVNTQMLVFDDNGNTSSYTLSVNSYTGNNGSLQVIYDLGGNNFTGMELAEAQEIIIDDIFE